MNRVNLESQISAELDGKRLDQALAILFPDYSRSLLQQWIKEGKLSINGKTCTSPKEKVKLDQIVNLDLEITPQGDWQAEAISLNILYEDDSFLIINKPAGLVVHPGAGNPKGTLLNALLSHEPSLQNIPRAGIVHRLDKDTSGLLVIAKTLETHTYLVRAIQERAISREYEAIVRGELISGSSVDAPIGRHPIRRTAMAVVGNGRIAITHYRIKARYPRHTRLRIKLETGRTHQIRVHMAHILHPIVGDPVYGKFQLVSGISSELQNQIINFKRQALHAVRLEFHHPITHELMAWEAPIPLDMQELIESFEKEGKL